jgi:thioredoxin reductase
VFTCPFCHAYEHDGEPFVVVGKGVGALDMALLCAVNANPLTVLVTDPGATTSTAADRVRGLGGTVVNDSVESAALTAPGELDLTTATGTRYRAGAVLLAGVMRIRAQLTAQLGLRTNELGVPECDTEGRSSRPRIWVAGTAAQPHYMLAESVGSGIRAGISIHKELCMG